MSPTYVGTAFLVDTKFRNSVKDFCCPQRQIVLLTFSAFNKKYILIDCHAPIYQDNRSNLDKVDEFWDSLEDELSKTLLEVITLAFVCLSVLCLTITFVKHGVVAYTSVSYTHLTVSSIYGVSSMCRCCLEQFTKRTCSLHGNALYTKLLIFLCFTGYS